MQVCLVGNVGGTRTLFAWMFFLKIIFIESGTNGCVRVGLQVSEWVKNTLQFGQSSCISNAINAGIFRVELGPKPLLISRWGSAAAQS